MKRVNMDDTATCPGSIGRGDLATFEQSSDREWLVTNGLGGFAAGTVSGANTRRYHGLLVAALNPPLGRTLMLSKLDAVATYSGREYALSSNEFADGSIDPHGYRLIERFRLEDGLPVWKYAFSDVLIEQRIIMVQGQNTSLAQFRVLRASADVQLTLRPLCTHRDYHSHGHGGWDFQTSPIDHGFQIDAYAGAQSYVVQANVATTVEYAPSWFWGFRHRIEAERGLDDTEDLFTPGLITIDLLDGQSVTITISTETSVGVTFEHALAEETARRHALIDSLPGSTDDACVRQLVYAADQFVVLRASDESTGGRTVIAGYPWFGDWGRDTMIALPGLTLTTGRYDIAKRILLTFADHIDQGMLPNRFPDHGDKPEYNTADATLWYVHAIYEYTKASGNLDVARQTFAALTDIVDWHQRGTRYGIAVDPDDGLLRAGEEGVQLTWMDAKVGDWVVTPRIGKPVEINVLWFNALKCIAELAKMIGEDTKAGEYNDTADRVAASYARFWNPELDCLYDVIDGPAGIGTVDGRRVDPSIRPNQILAVSLPHTPLDAQQRRMIVDACARDLVTSVGLRSLAPGAGEYIGQYGGDSVSRDGAYHQGTVWSWLLGPFAQAHYRVYGDAERARSFLQPLAGHLGEACVGSISEIFDGDAPHSAHGCFAQAWSVSETLRVWMALTREPDHASH